MMRKIFSLFALFSLLLVLHAQNNQKYLEGAITEIDGKVVFSRTLNVSKSVGKDQLFDIMKKWADEYYVSQQDDSKQRVLFLDKADYSIACQGDMDLVFKRTALSLDKAQMWYQLIIEVQNNKCELVVKGIKYQYNESGAKPTIYSAENMITDKYALKKKKDKLNNYYNKFRVATIDSIDALFNRVDVYLNGEQTVARKGAVEEAYVYVNDPVIMNQEEPQEIPLFNSAPVTANGITYNGFNEPSTESNYKSVQLNQIQLPLNQLLQNVLISAGIADDTNVISPLGSQVGYFFDKPTFSCILNSASLFNGVMNKDGIYTITIYTEQYKSVIEYCRNNNGRSASEVQKMGLTPFVINGNQTAFQQAQIIIECKLLMAPAKLDEGKYLLYTGEILNISVK